MSDEEINLAIAEACGCDEPLDYCVDLNAMHEAEQVLTLEQLLVYAECLESEYGFFGVAATARQRAEALLRTLGKWEEAK